MVVCIDDNTAAAGLDSRFSAFIRLFWCALECIESSPTSDGCLADRFPFAESGKTYRHLTWHDVLRLYIVSAVLAEPLLFSDDTFSDKAGTR